MMVWTKPVLGLVVAAISMSQALGQQKGAQPESKQPFEIVRSIQAIQDQIVRGNASARAKLPKLMEQISERLLAKDPDVWREPRNARAAVIYTLSGGQARVVRKVIETGKSPELELELMRGALAYVEGREADAKNILSKMEATALPPSTAGHVAIIQAALVAKENPGQAIRLLDQARVLAPGTLVEETALRRELVLADEIADIDKFAFLSSEYIWRFPNSAYFESFRQRFVASAIRFGLTIKPTQFPQLEDLVGQFNSSGQLGLYLMLAQKAIVDGKPGAARFAAAKAIQLSKDGSIERARSRLYEAAAFILTDQFEKGVSELDANDSFLLPKQDAELKEAVASLAKVIGNGPDNPEGTDPPEPSQHGVSPSGDISVTASASALINLSQQKLGQVDEVLERKAP